VITRTLVRRLERLEAYLAPPSDEPALIIHLTGVGHLTESSKCMETTLPIAGDSLGHRGERSRNIVEAEINIASP
jgi:hypothetical protein